MTSFSEGVDIEYRARLDSFKSEVAKIPGITKKAARELTRDWIAAQKQASAGAKRAASESERAWAKASSGIVGSLERAIPGLGRVTAMFGGAEQAGRAMLSSIGPGALVLGTLGVAGVGAAGGIWQATSATHDLARAVDQMAAKTGLGTDSVAGLRYAAMGADADFHALGQSVTTLTKKLGDATVKGSTEAAKLFDALGVEVRDAQGAFRTIDDVLPEVIDNLTRIESPTLRAQLQLELLGEAGVDLVDALDGSGDSLREWTRLAREAGVVIDGDLMEATERYDKASARLQLTWDGMTTRIGSAWLPALADLATMIASIDLQSLPSIGDRYALEHAARVEALGQGAGDAGDLVGGLGESLVDLGDMVSSTDTALDHLLETFEQVSEVAPTVEAAHRAVAAAAAVQTDAEDKLNNELQRRADLLAKIQGNAPLVGNFNAARGPGGPKGVNRDEGLSLGDAPVAAEVGDAPDPLEAPEDRAKREADARAERLAANAAEWSSYVGVAATALSQVSSLVEQGTQFQVDQHEKGTEGHKRAMRKQFAARKATAIAEAAVNMALAISNIWAQWAAVPIVAGVFTALAAGVGGAQIGLIAAAQPQFHGGGQVADVMRAPLGSAPDELTIQARRGEAVLNPTGAAVIGPRGVAEANRGERPGGGVSTVVHVWRGAVLDTMIADAVRAPHSPLAGALREARGRRLGHAGPGRQGRR